MSTRSPDAVLEALDPEQREVAANPSGPMVVRAGAGTGKTRAITHRVAYAALAGIQQPQHVLAVTFTARAAGELRTRVRELGVGGVQARTFHAAALRQLHFFWPQAVGGAAPEVMPHKAAAVAEAAGRLRMRFDRIGIRDLAAEIEWAKVGMVTPDAYPAAARAARREAPGVDLTAMARIMTAYEEVKSERGVIDFEDVLLVLVGILEEHEQVTRAIRAQYRHFLVDEYQDVNALQQRLLDLWVGGRGDLCVVGDPAQTIYSFTGASPRHLLEFAKRHPGAASVELTRNYRSTPQIVGLSNILLSAPGGARRSGSVVLRAQRDDGPTPTLVRYDDDPDEARGVAAEIGRLVAGGATASQIAVLFRTNAQSEAIESALADAEVPYLVRGGERFFQRKEVRDAILLLRGAARADDRSVPLPELVRDILVGAGWSRTAPTAGGAARERWESLSALANLADDVAALGEDVGLPAFVAILDDRAASAHAPTVEGVTLASLHAAKGLEWNHVFLVGCSDGLMPIVAAEGIEEIEEERRLLHVGITRARDTLHLSFAAARNPGGRASRRPSRFLESTVSVLGDRALPEGAAGRPKRSAKKQRQGAPTVCRGCGARLTVAAERTVGRCATCPATYDEALFEALRTWRLETSKAQGVPAYVVFTDATLTAIAEQQPSDRPAMARIGGVGQAKLDRYADDVLALVDAHVRTD
ncbi:MAG: UvrD-helicase domain-containing protein [Phycicoccus sp.]|nr:UvrD-helicase domain-containing protein [Phycicoccus sp.]